MKPRPPKRRAKAAAAHPDFLEGLLDSTSLVVYLKDVEGRYLYVNRRFEQLSTVPREALIGKRDHDFFPPKIAELFRTQDNEVAARRKSLEFEETIPLPGGVHSFITEKFPLFDAKGAVCATGGFCTEITAQKNRADESLAEERERLAVTMRSVTTGIVAADTSGRVVMLNAAAEALTGMSQALAAGLAVDEVLRAADPAQSGCFGRLAREALTLTGAPVPERDVVIVSATGTRRTVIPSASAVRERSGSVIGAVLCLRDMTELRRADEELFKIRSLESLGFLAGGIAHDFNNLLTGIVGNLELLGEELPAAGPARDLLKDAKSICGKASSLSRQLLTFADGTASNHKTFAPGPLLAEAARLVLHGSKVKSVVAAPAGLWPIDGDEAQFTQVLVNLLVNAREAMPRGGNVWIHAANHALDRPMLHLPAGRYVKLTVRDDGPGIAPAIMDRIFNPYFSSKSRGSGLGLTIVHSVVRRHGGHVWAEPGEGGGTVFALLVPASQKKVPRRPSGERSALQKGKGRILLMDDESVVADVARKILCRAGYTVSVERDGSAAVAAYRKALEAGKRFDAVILDLTVPLGMGGTEAAAEILALDPGARIILSSGYNKEERDPRAGAGRLPLLVKPYTIRQLTQSVAAAIRAGS